MCQWINIEEFEAVSCGQMVLFGAGKGAEELIAYIRDGGFSMQIQGIIDNDRSLWGQRLFDIPVMGPSDLSLLDFDRIVVTSISGRDAIAAQLENEGYRQPDDFILIGRYPATWRNTYLKLQSALAQHGGVEGKNCLHIGPGGFLGVEVLLRCFGAASVCSIDRYAFGIHYPDVTARFDEYREIKSQLGCFSPDAALLASAARQFDDLFLKENGRVSIDPAKISYLYPEDVCALPFSDKSFDVAVSFGVLEHVRAPGRAVAEIARVLKPGGISFHRIITADHRSFSKFDEFNPFSFRSYSERAWDRISSQKFYQNRVMPAGWRRLFEKSGLSPVQFDVDTVADLDDQLLNSFSHEFNLFSRKELGEVNCEILARK